MPVGRPLTAFVAADHIRGAARLAGLYGLPTSRASQINPALAQRWPRLWLPVSVIRGLSGLGGTFRLGSGWCPSRTRAAARKSSAASVNEVTGTYEACSRLERWR